MRDHLSSLMIYGIRLGFILSLAFGVVSIPTTVLAANSTGGYMAHGVGMDSGGRFSPVLLRRFEDLSAADQRSYLHYADWILGYLTAVNVIMPETNDILGNTDAYGVMVWLGQYGHDNPTESLVYATDELVKHLYPNRKKNKRLND